MPLPLIPLIVAGTAATAAVGYAVDKTGEAVKDTGEGIKSTGSTIATVLIVGGVVLIALKFSGVRIPGFR